MSIFVGTGQTVFIKQNAVGIGSTTTTGRSAGVSTDTGTLIYNATAREVQVYDGNAWTGGFTSPFSATGGSKDTTSRSGFAVHTFTGDDTFVVTGTPSDSVEFLVIGGGGGGGGGAAGGGGGGAGGFRSGSSLSVSPGTYPITVGGGGNGGPAPNRLWI